MIRTLNKKSLRNLWITRYGKGKWAKLREFFNLREKLKDCQRQTKILPGRKIFMKEFYIKSWIKLKWHKNGKQDRVDLIMENVALMFALSTENRINCINSIRRHTCYTWINPKATNKVIRLLFRGCMRGVVEVKFVYLIQLYVGSRRAIFPIYLLKRYY